MYMFEDTMTSPRILGCTSAIQKGTVLCSMRSFRDSVVGKSSSLTTPLDQTCKQCLTLYFKLNRPQVKILMEKHPNKI